ncbi:MAG: PrsW family intramembrane metalloprotease [Alphaproteobacteria bacterium]|nr:PrsW family intramembrane metalloprotease [Alphaproteobacteria bacterium]
MSDPNRTQMLDMLPPPDNSGRRMVAVSCGLIVLVTVAWTAVCAGLISSLSFLADPVLTTFSAVAAVALAVPYGLVILWIDRHEREPPLLLASAFLWGAVIATMISLIFNMSFQAVMGGLGADEASAAQLTASFSAPFVEELSKATAMVALYAMFRHHLDNVLDGVVYGALVGLGFAVFENFIYYVNTGNLGGAIGLVCVRGVITSPGSHACFTAISGVAFGLFRVRRAGALRWAIPPAGVALAMFVHFSWNTFTQLFLTDNGLLNLFVGLPAAVLVIQIPFVLLVVIVSTLALWHERSLITRYLSSEKPPVLLPNDIESLVPARRRTLKSLRLVLSGDIGGWWRFRKRCDALVELAFEKWHMDAEASLGDEGARTHATRVMELRKELTAMGAPPA